jgi:hypothetical protein
LTDDSRTRESKTYSEKNNCTNLSVPVGRRWVTCSRSPSSLFGNRRFRVGRPVPVVEMDNCHFEVDNSKGEYGGIGDIEDDGGGGKGRHPEVKWGGVEVVMVVVRRVR